MSDLKQFTKNYSHRLPSGARKHLQMEQGFYPRASFDRAVAPEKIAENCTSALVKSDSHVVNIR